MERWYGIFHRIADAKKKINKINEEVMGQPINDWPVFDPYVKERLTFETISKDIIKTLDSRVVETVEHERNHHSRCVFERQRYIDEMQRKIRDIDAKIKMAKLTSGADSKLPGGFKIGDKAFSLIERGKDLSRGTPGTVTGLVNDNREIVRQRLVFVPDNGTGQAWKVYARQITKTKPEAV